MNLRGTVSRMMRCGKIALTVDDGGRVNNRLALPLSMVAVVAFAFAQLVSVAFLIRKRRSKS